MPRSSNVFFHALAFPASANNSSTGQCPVPGYPPVPISKASRPSALTLSNISSSDSLSYTGSKTPMGILRNELPEACAEDVTAELDSTLAPSEKFAPCATLGNDAASRPVPVAARNSLRSMRDDSCEFFMRSPQRCAAAFFRTALYDSSSGGKLRHSLRLDRIESGNRRGYGKHALRRPFLLLNRSHKHLDGLTRIGRNKDGGRQQTAAHPRLPRFRQAVATGEWHFQPAFALHLAGQFLEGLARANGHRVILRSDHVHRNLLRSRQHQPRTNCALRTFFRPLSTQRNHLDVRRFALLHTQGPFLRRGILRGPLNVKHRSPARQERGKLTSLNPPNLHMIRADGENRRVRPLAQILYVIRIAIQHRPSDACGGRHARHLRQRGSADGLEHNRVRTVLRRRLNGSQNLCALIDGVVVRVNNLRAHAQLACGLLRGLRLLDLEIVIVGSQRNQNSYLRHRLGPRSQRVTIHPLASLCREIVFLRCHHDTTGSPQRRSQIASVADFTCLKLVARTGIEPVIFTLRG